MLAPAFLLTATLGMNIMASLVGIFTTVRLYFKLEKSIHLILLMTSILLCWGLSNTFLLIGGIYPEDMGWRPFSIAFLFLVLSFSIFTYFIAIFSGDLSPIKIVAVITYPVASYTLWIAEFFSKTSLLMVSLQMESDFLVEYYHVGFWADLGFFIAGSGVLLTGFWVIRGLNSNLEYAHNLQQIKSLKSMRLGSVLAFLVGPTVGFPGYLLIRTGQNISLGIHIFYVGGYSLISVGVFLFAFTYFGKNDISFLLPQKIEKLLVVHANGVALYSYDFNRTEQLWNAQLLSGLVSATTSLMGESLGIETTLKEIAFHDRHILINVRGEIAFVLVSKNRSHFIKEALDTFGQLFLQNFEIPTEHSAEVFKLFEEPKVIPLISVSFGLPVSSV
ncbi:MAG: hypothetical protein ACXAE3_13485 [Candidatus Kariarchaeaceae archaeon]